MKEFAYPVTVQFEDVDSYRIVHHTKLVAYLERARVNFLAQRGFEIRENTLELVLYSLSMQFKKPAQFLDALMVCVGVKSVESFRITLNYRITRGKDLIAKAETDVAFVHPGTKEIMPVPEGLF